MRYVVTDTETTGITHGEDRIVEVAMVWREQDNLCWGSSLANPGKSIPPESMAVHHITEQDVHDAPSPAEALFRVLRLAGVDESVVMVAHNAPFDRGFLAPLSPVIETRPWICTWKCSMHLWPDAPGHGNQVLRYWLKIDPELPSDLYPHRALYDTIVTECILQRMLESHTLEELIELSTKPVLLSTVRFGKHRGVKWSDVPHDYLQWLLRQSDLDPDTRHTALHWANAQGRIL